MKRGDNGMGFLLQYENVAWYEDGKVRILDRRIYPIKIEYVTCTKHEEVAGAIADMVTQSGGPYTAAAMGMALAAYEVMKNDIKDIEGYMEKAAYTLSHARPTTASKMEAIVATGMDIVRACLKSGETGQKMVDKLAEYAVQRMEDTYVSYKSIAKYLGDQIPKNGVVLTQCFAETIIGALLNYCREIGNDVKMICAETRPLLQGARLTASVCADMGFNTTVISDNMVCYAMKEKKIDVFTSAADLITMDGHVINKVGTLQAAVCAHYWGIPYFTTGSPNPRHPDLASSHIEQREEILVRQSMGTTITLDSVKGYYPAFDVTPPKLVNGIVTNKGIFSPYDLASYFKK